MKKPIAIMLSVIAILALVSGVTASSIVLTERETKDGIEQIVVDDDTLEVSIYLDGKLIETRPATDREADALKRQAADNERKLAVDDLRSSVADIKGRPLQNVNDRLDRLEQALIDLAAAIGIE